MRKVLLVLGLILLVGLTGCKPQEEESVYVSSVEELVDKEVTIIHGENHEAHQLIYNNVAYDINVDCMSVHYISFDVPLNQDTEFLVGFWVNELIVSKSKISGTEISSHIVWWPEAEHYISM